MAPKYFTGDVVSAMNKHRTLLRQTAARQAGRGLTAGAMGAQGRVEEAQEFLDNTSLGAINARRQERFGKRVSLMGESVDRGARREDAIRQDTLQRDLRDLDAEIAKMQAELSAATATASYNNDRIRRQVDEYSKRREESYGEASYGSLRVQDMRRQRDSERDAVQSNLTVLMGGGEAGSYGVRDADGRLQGSLPAGADPIALAFEEYGMYLDGRDRPAADRILSINGPPGFDPLAIGGGGLGQGFTDDDKRELLYGLIHSRVTENLGSAADATALLAPGGDLANNVNAFYRQAGIEPPTAEQIGGYRTFSARIANGEQLNEHVQGMAAAGQRSAYTSMAPPSARGARVTEQQLGAYMDMPPDQLANMGLGPQAVAAIQAAQQQEDDRLRRDVIEVLVSGGSRDPGAVEHDVSMLLSDLSPERARVVYQNASQAASQQLQTDVPTYEQMLEAGGTRAQQLRDEADAALDELLSLSAGVGVDTSGVQAAQARVNENREQERRTYADEAAFTADPENAALLEAAQKGELDSAGQAELEERLARIEDDGTTLVMGIQVPNHMVPQPGDVQGEIELLTYLTMNYPNHPTVAQSRDAMMASPEFQAWREARNYTGEPDAWMWRQFTREYKVQKRMNRAQNKAQARVNQRAGITLDDAEMPDMPSDDVKLTRRAGRQYRRDVRGAAAERLQSERQAQRPAREEREPSTPLFERLRAAGNRQRSEPEGS